MVRRQINVDDISPNPSIHPEIYQLIHNSEHLSVRGAFRCESSQIHNPPRLCTRLKGLGGWGGGKGGSDGSFDVVADNPHTYEWTFSSRGISIIPPPSLHKIKQMGSRRRRSVCVGGGGGRVQMEGAPQWHVDQGDSKTSAPNCPTIVQLQQPDTQFQSDVSTRMCLCQ